MGKFTAGDLGTQNIDLSLERNNMDDLMNVKRANASTSRRAADTTNPTMEGDEVTPVATDTSLPLQSPGGTSTGSISTANNTNTNSVASSDAQSISSGSDLAESTKVDPEVLLAQIKYQVEFYFSQQNLNRDRYMQEQMNEEGYIPIKTIADFKQVKRLTSNLDLILQAMANSSICTINESRDMIKASWKRPARTTIIIREAGENVTESDIRDLFQGTEFTINSIRSDVAQTWFVTMDSEEDAKSALLYIIGKTLNGQGIKARLKSETLPAPAPAPPVFPVNDMAVPFPGQPGAQQYFGGYQVPQPGMNYNMMNYGPNPMSQWNPNMAYPGYDQSTVAPNADNSTSHLMMNAAHPGIGGDGAGMLKPQHAPKAPRRTGAGEGGSRRRPNGNMMNTSAGKPSQMMATKKKKAPITKRIKTPVFQAYDFPSLPMGKITLDSAETEATVDATETAEVKPKSTSFIKATPQALGSSWAAAVAKVPSPPAVKPAAPSSLPNGKVVQPKHGQSQGAKTAGATATKAQPSREQGKATVERGRVAAKTAKGKISVKTPAAVSQHKESDTLVQAQPVPRPKRGWEKPGLAPITAAKAEPKGDSAEKPKARQMEAKAAIEAKKGETEKKSPAPNKTVEGSSATKEVKEKPKPSLGAWGTKKSFADIIKGGGEPVPVKTPTSAPTVPQPAPEPSKSVHTNLPAKKSPVKMMNSGFGRSRGSSVDGDWRRKDTPKINVHGK